MSNSRSMTSPRSCRTVEISMRQFSAMVITFRSIRPLWLQRNIWETSFMEKHIAPSILRSRCCLVLDHQQLMCFWRSFTRFAETKTLFLPVLMNRISLISVGWWISSQLWLPRMKFSRRTIYHLLRKQSCLSWKQLVYLLTSFRTFRNPLVTPAERALEFRRKALLDKSWRGWNEFVSKLVIEFLKRRWRMMSSRRGNLELRLQPMKAASRILATTHLLKQIAVAIPAAWAVVVDKTFPAFSRNHRHHPALIRGWTTSIWVSVESSSDRRYCL